MARDAAQALLRVRTIRERERKLALAEANEELAVAEQALEIARVRHEAALTRANEGRLGLTSMAQLSVATQALIQAEGRVRDAKARVAEATVPVDEAIDALADAARERLVCEKWVERRRKQRLTERRRKETRAADDQAADRFTRRR